MQRPSLLVGPLIPELFDLAWLFCKISDPIHASTSENACKRRRVSTDDDWVLRLNPVSDSDWQNRQISVGETEGRAAASAWYKAQFALIETNIHEPPGSM